MSARRAPWLALLALLFLVGLVPTTLATVCDTSANRTDFEATVSDSLIGPVATGALVSESRRCTIALTWPLFAPPRPTTACLTSRADNSATWSPVPASAAMAAPRA